jgi:GT2 family glycosyltransferase
LNVSIIIVNYNTTEFVRNCIQSIKSIIKNIEYEIIVVDNNSADKTIASLENFFEDVKIIYKNKNDGFGSGCNYGSARSSGKYLWFLNPDVSIVNNIAEVFIDFMKKNESTGVCSALITGMDDKYQYCFNDFPGIRWELQELTGYLSNKRINKLNNRARLSGDRGLVTEIDWAIGACLFIRREIFEKVAGFDERFFLYYEDTDLQKRIKDIGYKVVLFGDQKVRHLGKSSIEDSEYGSSVYFSNMHISKLKYYKYHKNSFYTLIVRSINITAFLLRIFTLPFRNIPEDTKRNKYKTFKSILKIYSNFKNA